MATTGGKISQNPDTGMRAIPNTPRNKSPHAAETGNGVRVDFSQATSTKPSMKSRKPNNKNQTEAARKGSCPTVLNIPSFTMESNPALKKISANTVWIIEIPIIQRPIQLFMNISFVVRSLFNRISYRIIVRSARPRVRYSFVPVTLTTQTPFRHAAPAAAC